MTTSRIVILLKYIQLIFQAAFIEKQRMVQKLPPSGANGVEQLAQEINQPAQQGAVA
jgi:sulfur transfer protein SufE